MSNNTPVSISCKSESVLADLDALGVETGLEYIYIPLHTAPSDTALLVVGVDILTNIADWPDMPVDGTIGNIWTEVPGWFTAQAAENNKCSTGANRAAQDFLSTKTLGPVGSLFIQFQIGGYDWAGGTAQIILTAGVSGGSNPHWQTELSAAEKLTLFQRGTNGTGLSQPISDNAGTTTNGLRGGNEHSCSILLTGTTTSDGEAHSNFSGSSQVSVAQTVAAGFFLPGTGDNNFDEGLNLFSGITAAPAVVTPLADGTQLSDIWIIRYPGKDLAGVFPAITAAFKKTRAEPPRNLAALLSA